MSVPRVAFFTDSYHEVNGVALTSRQFAGFAQARGYPFFSVHTGPRTLSRREGEFETFEIEPGRWVLRLETDLSFDLLFARHCRRIRTELAAFRPDLVHVTGPGHCGLLGAILAHELRVPLVASWHTNVHQFGARRLEKLLRFAPRTWRRTAASFAEKRSLELTLRFYKLARLLFAPNPELVTMLEERTGMPAHLMIRGIDSGIFSPRQRRRYDDAFVIGYVGRLSAEKNVRMLVELERALIRAGVRNYRFVVVGDGGERSWLTGNLLQAELPGILQGEALTRAYANMDVFVFPSQSDTFGNVVLEAMASGVAPVVSAEGGPKYLVRSGCNGYLASSTDGFFHAVMMLYDDQALCKRMGHEARRAACSYSWEAVFEGVYQRYEESFAGGVLTPRAHPAVYLAS